MARVMHGVMWRCCLWGDDVHMKQELFCRACGQTISKPVLLYAVDETSNVQPKETHGEPICAEGTALILTGDHCMRWRSINSALQYALNLNDISQTIGLTKMVQRLNGCCGLDGCDGPNRVCDCGADVGTQCDDCWMPARFVPLGDATGWRDAPW
jgi:hypothetical protein